MVTKQKFINQWLRRFAPDLQKKDFEKFVKGQYIWHVFSWNLIAAQGLLVGDAARQAFDAENKDGCLCCHMFGDAGVTEGLPSRYDTARSIDELQEIYIVAKDFAWTYIKTHENDLCGPYFLRRSYE